MKRLLTIFYLTFYGLPVVIIDMIFLPLYGWTSYLIFNQDELPKPLVIRFIEWTIRNDKTKRLDLV